tara:strand:+ start:1219 stop:1392 length:174 start_codon:yes stop_codon:yes gene_type:complete
MAANMRHFLKNGTEWKGDIHKTGTKAMTGATHNSTSKLLFHMKDLSASATKRANKKT